MKLRKFLLCITFALIVAFGLTSGVLATTAEGEVSNLSTSLVPSAVEPRVTMIDLGTLGGATSYGRGINDRGQIVGGSDTSSGEQHAFLWENGTMTDLGTLGGMESAAWGINDRGQIVGGSDTSSGEQHAVLWEDGTMTDLGTLEGAGGSASGINDRGQIVGWTFISGVPDRAFLWADGTITDVLGIGGAFYDVNDRGQIVGWSDTGSGSYHALLWEDGTMIDLGTHSCAPTVADINGDGELEIIAGVETGRLFYFSRSQFERSRRIRFGGNVSL